ELFRSPDRFPSVRRLSNHLAVVSFRRRLSRPSESMIYTAIDNFYLPEEQIKNSPSRKDGIDEATETTLRIYGCDLIQEAGILLRLPQAVMATGQVLFHRFYCKKSLAKFDVKIVAASCVWLASKLEENPKKARQVIIVFHRMECRRENLPLDHLDLFSKKYSELKVELSRTERHILKEMGFVCHVEHPHKFISNYLATLETPPELRQEAWNLANDSLRTTLCVRFRSEVVACGVVYAAARRFQVPLPENPPWWKAFDADKSGIDEVCRVLAHLYSLPKAQYISVCKDGKPFTFSSRSANSQSQSATKDFSPAVGDAVDTKCPSGSESKDGKITTPHEMATDAKKSDTESNSLPIVGDSREERRKVGESDREKERGRERDRVSRSHRDRGRDSDKESDRERDKLKEHSHHRSRDRLKDSGDRSRHHSSRDRDYRESSHSSKDRRSRHH
ncbi:unnamed protein product, partial [Brassica napus]